MSNKQLNPDQVDFNTIKQFIRFLSENKIIEDVIHTEPELPSSSSSDNVHKLNMSLEVYQDILSNPNYYLIEIVKQRIKDDHPLYNAIDPDNIEILFNIQRPSSEGMYCDLMIGNKKSGWTFSFFNGLIIDYDSPFPVTVSSVFSFNETKKTLDEKITTLATDSVIELVNDFEYYSKFLMNGLDKNTQSKVYESMYKHLQTSKFLSPVFTLINKKQLHDEIKPNNSNKVKKHKL